MKRGSKYTGQETGRQPETAGCQDTDMSATRAITDQGYCITQFSSWCLLELDSSMLNNSYRLLFNNFISLTPKKTHVI